MSSAVTRRTSVLGSAASALSGGVIITLPTSHAALPQEATPLEAIDPVNLGLPTLDITVNADSYEGMPAETAAGRYLVTATLVPGLVDPALVVFIRPPKGMSIDTFRTIALGEQRPGSASPAAAPAGGGPPP